jgi:NAD(P)-dependent dehydrogenase (short-subunit alcohol dehydrogenase family)
MTERPLAGRVAMVAGAGRGIGREFARWLSSAGADLVVCARTANDVGALAGEVERDGGNVLALPCDIADPGAVDELVASAIERFGRIDIAVANAAILGPVGAIDVVDPRAWAQTLAVNVAGTASIVRAVLPTMAAQGAGRIITMSGGGVGGPNLPSRLSAYVASKGAVMLLTEALSLELPEGVTINSIAPGAVPTTFMDEVRSVGPDIAGDALFDTVVNTAMPDLEPLRDLLLYVAGDDSGWLNGRCLSARWDPPSVLRKLTAADVTGSRFRLRRVDEDLFGDLGARP